MYLSKLEIQGFKSFAEKTVLEFNRSLTAIVGPNGSGKSNVADAVRWVLGEQSLKMLRGKKSEDVIFAGSPAKARLGFAEVSMMLDNSDGRAPVDYREIVITRRIYRNGDSEYLINKNKVRLLDIQLLLAKSSFGQRTYSIIGQGMVDAILTSSPTERKEFFDEATGVRAWQLKKEQAENKLQSSRENLAQTEQLIAEIEPRLRSLTRQIKRLEKKSEVEKELVDWQKKYFSHILENLENKVDQLNASLKIKEKNKQEIEAKLNDLTKQIETEQLADTTAEAWQKLQREYQKISEEKNNLTKELSVLTGRLELKLVQAGKSDLVWLNKRLQEIIAKEQEMQNQLPSLENDLANIEKMLASKEKENELLQNLIVKTQTEISKCQNETNNYPEKAKAKINQQITDIYAQQRDFLEYLPTAQNQDKPWENITAKAQEIMAGIKNLAELMEENQTNSGADLNSLNQQIKEVLTKKEALLKEINDYNLQKEIIKQQLLQAKDKLKEIREEKDKLDKEIAIAAPTDNNTELNQVKKTLEDKLTASQKELSKLEKQLGEFTATQQEQRRQLIQLQQSLRQEQDRLSAEENKINEIKIELARLETKTEELNKEIATANLTGFAREKNVELNPLQAEAEINRFKNQLAIIGAIDEEAIKEYDEVNERYTFLHEQITDLNQAMISCGEIIEDLNKKISEQFEIAFEKINTKFQEYFKILFNGGQAKLSLQKKEIIEKEESEENASEENIDKQISKNDNPAKGGSASGKKKYEIGIEIEATPPGKRLKSMAVLSGGEKALTSIALISAIMANNPSPFVILDEVDAALDEANSERFAMIVKELSDKTQFICVTHNRATMHHAAILYGITMGSDGISKLLSINLTEAEKVITA